MDIIASCLSAVPLPCLGPAFGAFRFVYDSVNLAQASKLQLRDLAENVAKLLVALNHRGSSGSVFDIESSPHLRDLNSLIIEVGHFVDRENKKSFVKLLFVKEARIAQILSFSGRLTTLVQGFQITSNLNMSDWARLHEAARVQDMVNLNAQLSNINQNQNLLIEALQIEHGNIKAMMSSFARRLRDGQTTLGPEADFYRKSLQCLTIKSGQQPVMEDWTVSSYDVEFDEKMGEGGFGEVWRGKWKSGVVALKVLKSEAGVIADPKMIQHEVKVWKGLEHSNVIEFLGANVLDERPFIVMPYMQNGNAQSYLQSNPDANRDHILHDIVKGLCYLHAKKIVHGDVKAANVLISDSGTAVLCDFGLSHIRADTQSRSRLASGESVYGSPNWMSPELFKGRRLRAPSDIYALGMTIYEIYCNEIPWGNLPVSRFQQLVMEDERPERPEEDDCPFLTDQAWSLAELCWLPDPAARPTSVLVESKLNDWLVNQPDSTTESEQHHSSKESTLSPLERQAEECLDKEQAVVLWRRLYTMNPTVYDKALASSLHVYSFQLDASGRPGGALQAEEEAVQLRRRLFFQDADANRKDLATSLHSLGFYLTVVGSVGDACLADKEAVKLWRQLYAQDSDAHGKDLANSLHSLGLHLSRVGRTSDACLAYEEAVKVRGQLYAQDENAHRKDLANSLHNYGFHLNAMGRAGDACTADEAAVTLRRQLYAQDPNTHRKSLASSLHNYGIHLSVMGEHRARDACLADEEAVILRRQLYAQDANSHRKDLANSLHNYGASLTAIGRHKEASAAAKECKILRK